MALRRQTSSSAKAPFPAVRQTSLPLSNRILIARWLRLIHVVPVLFVVASCSRQEDRPTQAIWRLVDHSPAPAGETRQVDSIRQGWTWAFDDPSQEWKGIRDAESVRIEGGTLRGRTTGHRPLVATQTGDRALDVGDSDERVWGVELRARISQGTSIGVQVSPRSESPEDFQLLVVTPVARRNEMVTYRLRTDEVGLGFRGPLARIKWVGIMPANTPGATFEIESLRFMTQEEVLAGVTEGPGRFGLDGVWYDAVATRAPSVLTARLVVPKGARLSLSVAVPQPRTVKFRVSALIDRELFELANCTVRPQRAKRAHGSNRRWQYLEADLADYGGKEIELQFVTESKANSILAYWGNVTVAAPRRGGRPNVLVYMIDTLRQDRLSAYGYARETSPRIHEFGEQGSIFESAIAQSTWTKISVTSLFSSLYPTEHGVLRWGQKLADEATTFAERLRAAGYATMAVSTNSFVGNDSNLQQGFDVFYESDSVASEYRSGSSESIRGGGKAHQVNGLLEVWLPRMAHGRFMIYAHVTDPHAPYSPRDDLRSLWRPNHAEDLKRQKAWNTRLRPLIPAGFHRRAALPQTKDLDELGIPHAEYISFYSDMYDAEIRQVDAEFGRLLDQLNTLGLADDTLVILVSDHGEQFFEHGGTGHADNVYAETVRVPLIMRWPRGIRAGLRVEEVVGLIDVFPIALDLLGLEPTPNVSGLNSVTQHLRVSAATATPVVSVGDPASGVAGLRGVYSERHAAPAEQAGTAFARQQIAVTLPRWRGVENLAPLEDEPRFALYDRTIDPLDQRNVADDHPEVAAKVRRALLAWYQKVELRSDLRPGPGDVEMPRGQLEQLRSLGYIE